MARWVGGLLATLGVNRGYIFRVTSAVNNFLRWDMIYIF